MAIRSAKETAISHTNDVLDMAPFPPAPCCEQVMRQERLNSFCHVLLDTLMFQFVNMLRLEKKYKH